MLPRMRWNTGVVGIIDDWAVGHFCANQRTGFIYSTWTPISSCGDEKQGMKVIILKMSIIMLILRINKRQLKGFVLHNMIFDQELWSYCNLLLLFDAPRHRYNYIITGAMVRMYVFNHITTQ